MLTLEVRKGEGMLEAINNKELKLIEILSIAMNLFIRKFRMVMVVVAFLFFPISILNAMIMERVNDSAQLLMSLNEAGVILENMPAHMELLLKSFENDMLLMAVFLFLEPVGIISIAKIAKKSICNETIQIHEVIGDAMNCLWNVIITGVPYLILVFVAGMLFIIPGIYLVIVWTFYVYAIGLRQIKGWKALEYSKGLVKGNFWKTLLILTATLLITLGWNWIFGTVYLFLPQHIGTEILYYTLTYIDGSFAFIVITVLFMNREAILLGVKHGVTENVIENALDVKDK